jgi:hypothetical protein
MDNLDRMYRHLVRTVRSRFPQYLTQPFEVSELYQTIMPYRHHRRELGLETNEDYEITLSGLLAGGRDYLIVDDQMRDVLRAELAAPNPDPSVFKQFAQSRVALSPTALRSLEAGPPLDKDTAEIASVRKAEPVAPSATVGASAGASIAGVERAAAAASAPARESTRETLPASARPTPVTPPTISNPGRPSMSTPGAGSIVPTAGERCRSCSGILPEGRSITFCPHCGQNLTTMNCPACGSELELGWKFCPTCGRPAGQSG